MQTTPPSGVAGSGVRDRFSWAELAAHAALAAGLLWLALFLHENRPVDYVRLIAEDNLGEYASAVAWLLMAFFFAVLAMGSPAKLRKIIWTTIAAFAFFVGMEEISWGQRILGIATPEALQEINSQGELTLHNILVPNDTLHIAAAWLILGGVIASALLQAPLVLKAPIPAAFRDWLDRVGIPMVPAAIIPWFLLTAHLFLGASLVKADELGELAFGIGLAFLGFYSWLRFRNSLAVGRPARLLGVVGVLAFVGVGAQFLMSFGHEGGLGDRLRRTATRDYPALGMYEQAGMLFEYMQRHPEYLRQDTRIAWSRILLARSENDEAMKLLEESLLLLRESGRPKDAAYLRDEGEILTLMGRKSEGQVRLDRAFEIDARNLSTAAATERAEILWSQARTYAVKGELEQALRLGHEAESAAVSATLRKRIANWTLALTAPVSDD